MDKIFWSVQIATSPDSWNEVLVTPDKELAFGLALRARQKNPQLKSRIRRTDECSSN